MSAPGSERMERIEDLLDRAHDDSLATQKLVADAREETRKDLNKRASKRLVQGAIVAAIAVALLMAWAIWDNHQSSSSINEAEKCLATTQQLQLVRTRALATPTTKRTNADRRVRHWDTVEQRVFRRIISGDKHQKRLKHRFGVANLHKLHWEHEWRRWDDEYRLQSALHPVPNQKLCDVLVKRLPVRTVTTTAPAPSPSVRVSRVPVPGPTTYIRVPGPTTYIHVPGPTTTVPPGKAPGRHRHHP